MKASKVLLESVVDVTIVFSLTLSLVSVRLSFTLDSVVVGSMFFDSDRGVTLFDVVASSVSPAVNDELSLKCKFEEVLGAIYALPAVIT